PRIGAPRRARCRTPAFGTAGGTEDPCRSPRTAGRPRGEDSRTDATSAWLLKALRLYLPSRQERSSRRLSWMSQLLPWNPPSWLIFSLQKITPRRSSCIDAAQTTAVGRRYIFSWGPAARISRAAKILAHRREAVKTTERSSGGLVVEPPQRAQNVAHRNPRAILQLAQPGRVLDRTGVRRPVGENGAALRDRETGVAEHLARVMEVRGRRGEKIRRRRHALEANFVPHCLIFHSSCPSRRKSRIARLGEGDDAFEAADRP